jgi:hypothetical protein
MLNKTAACFPQQSKLDKKKSRDRSTTCQEGLTGTAGGLGSREPGTHGFLLLAIIFVLFSEILACKILRAKL